MIKVLLADDEPRTIRYMATVLPWTRLGMEIIGTASNGIEALHLLQSQPVDLLITDIRMPGMDGLVLCREVRKRHLELPIILLTGFADFTYAQSAIELQVSAYCLKPIDPEQMTKTLLHVVKQSYQKTPSRADALLDLIEEGNASQIEQALSKLGLMKNTVYTAASYGVHNIEKALGAQFSCKVGRHKYIYLSDNPMCHQEASHIAAYAKKRSGIGILPAPTPFHMLSSAISDVLVMSFQYFINGTSTICDRLVEGPLTEELFLQLPEMIHAPGHLKKWLHDLSAANCSMLFNMRTAFRFLNKILLSPYIMETGDICLDSFEQMTSDYACLSELLEVLSQSVYSKNEKTSPTLTRPDTFLAIMSYLNEHYKESISLKQIAEALHLNASYISQLIKTETGVNYSQYMTELRINKARELLETTSLSLAAISEAVGFNDYFYFIKKFKKEVGITPGKYKSTHI